MNSLPTFSDVTEQALAKEPDHHDISTNTPESMPARERAGVHAGLQVCMWRPQACTYVVHTCTSMCMPARGSCARARRGACVHKARARMHVDVYASTRFMHACSPMCIASTS